MIVRYRQTNIVSGLEELRRATRTGLASQLTEGVDYLVFGVVIHCGEVCYLICPEDEDEYPHRYLSGFFEVLDPRLPPGWMGNFGRMTNFGRAAILPKFFYDDPFRLEKLVDGDVSSVRQFFALKSALRSWHLLQEKSGAAINSILNDEPIAMPDPSKFHITFGSQLEGDRETGWCLELADFEESCATLSWSEDRHFRVMLQDDDRVLFDGSFFGLTSIGIMDDSIVAEVLGPPTTTTVQIQIFPKLSTKVRTGGELANYAAK